MLSKYAQHAGASPVNIIRHPQGVDFWYERDKLDRSRRNAVCFRSLNSDKITLATILCDKYAVGDM